MLWFAFNFGYLWHRYHCNTLEDAVRSGCDLLSILGIFDIAITLMIRISRRFLVVICFQFWVSLTSLSLFSLEWRHGLALWFAFNFGYLWHRYHLRASVSASPVSCDLLSILGIFDIAITPVTKETDLVIVVICFQFWVSLTSLSLCRLRAWSKLLLWFAFNFGYLWHRYHFKSTHLIKWRGCDLLSILGIFDIAITELSTIAAAMVVVICFQFWVSLTSLSLFYPWRCWHVRLWFAFNFGYLWHRYHYWYMAAGRG